MRKATLLIAAGLPLLLAGCDMAPKNVQPALPVPPTLPAGPAYPAQTATAEPAANPGWEAFFVEPRLREVVSLALANNRDLQVALANVQQARALYRVQRADLFPTIAGNGAATYQKTPAALAGLTTGGTTGATPSNAGGSARFDIYSANVGLSAWEVDLFGRVRNLSKAAFEQYLASAANRDAAQTALIAETATAWLAMAADQERLRIARATEGLFRQTLDLTQARFAKGIGSELDVRQATTSWQQARSDVADATTLVAQDHNALDLLAGTPLAPALLPTGLAEAPVTIDRLPAGVASDVLLRRPDVIAAEHQLRAANANIGAARAAFFPNVSLTAAFGTLSLGLSNLFGSGSQTWSVAPTVTLPIFDFGRNQGNLRYSQATRDAMVATYEKTVQSAFREVADALARRGTIDAQLEAQTGLRDAAQGAYRLSEARFRAGVDPFFQTLDAQRTLYGAQRSLLATRLTYATNMVELYRSLGGGLR